MEFTASITVERTEGKFTAADEIAEKLSEAIEAADLSGIGPDDEVVVR